MVGIRKYQEGQRQDVAQDGNTQQGKQPSKAPISAHPAFPLMVGLWFAALLGLGTIVLPAIVLEKASGAIGLSTMFPQTEAPLTAGARAAFALLATAVGLAGGLALARRVAKTQVVARPPRARAPRAGGRAAAPRPLSVHEELGEDAIAPAVDEQRKPLPGRRRALAVAHEEGPSDFLLAAPVPGGETQSPPPLPDDEDAMSERASEIELTGSDEVSAEIDLSDVYAPPLDTRKPREFAAPSAPEPADHTLEPLSLEPIDAPLEDLGIVQLAERLGRAMQRRLSEPKSQPEPEAETLAFSAPSLEQAAEPQSIDQDALVVPPPVVPDALRAFMDTLPEPTAADDAPLIVPAPVVPAALQSFTLGSLDADEDDEDEALDPGPFSLPLATMKPRPFASPEMDAADTADDEPDEDEDESVAANGYSSLLSMTNAFRATEEFVRVDQPDDQDDGSVEPAVVFPGQAPASPQPIPAKEIGAANVARPFDAPHQPAPSTAPVRARAKLDPVETERALRSALANLQRMSGTA